MPHIDNLHASKVSKIETRSRTVLEVVWTNKAERGTESNCFPSTHTGANRLSPKRPRKQRRGGGEVDLQIKLLSLCPLKGPAVTSAFVRGRRNDQANDLASLLGRTLLQRKRDREEEKEAFPRTCSLLCLSQCRIYPNQHTCQPDSYKRFPTLL